MTPRAGSLAVVGLGPGDASTCTPEARAALDGATDWVGYQTYLDQACEITAPRADQTLHGSDNREEATRARHALDLAAQGRSVAVISSGDPGVFAMAAAVMEQLDGASPPAAWAAVTVTVVPGVSAAQAAAARAGAPLGHDFCVISLSDNLKPWSVIERRLAAAAAADFVIALYNPRSRHRPDQFARALAVIGTTRDGATPVVVARDVARPGEQVHVTTLAELTDPAGHADVDMRTVVIVGSSTTRIIDHPDRPSVVYTPRSYPA